MFTFVFCRPTFVCCFAHFNLWITLCLVLDLQVSKTRRHGLPHKKPDCSALGTCLSQPVIINMTSRQPGIILETLLYKHCYYLQNVVQALFWLITSIDTSLFVKDVPLLVGSVDRIVRLEKYTAIFFFFKGKTIIWSCCLFSALSLIIIRIFNETFEDQDTRIWNRRCSVDNKHKKLSFNKRSFNGTKRAHPFPSSPQLF